MAISHHIHRLREKPAHVRERIALGVSGGITTLVFAGWLVAMGSSGAFSIATQSVAHSVTPPDDVQKSLSEGARGMNSLLGAASAALSGSTTSAVEVVDVRTTSTLDATTTKDATVIPF